MNARFGRSRSSPASVVIGSKLMRQAVNPTKNSGHRTTFTRYQQLRISEGLTSVRAWVWSARGDGFHEYSRDQTDRARRSFDRRDNGRRAQATLLADARDP